LHRSISTTATGAFIFPLSTVQDSIAKQAMHMWLYLKSSACVSGSLQGYLAGAFFDNRKAFSVFIKAPLQSQISLASLASVVKTFDK